MLEAAMAAVDKIIKLLTVQREAKKSTGKERSTTVPSEFLPLEPEALREALFSAVARIKAYKDREGRLPFDQGCPNCGIEPHEHLFFSEPDPDWPSPLLAKTVNPLRDAIEPFTPGKTPKWAVDIAEQALAQVGIEVSESTIRGTLFPLEQKLRGREQAREAEARTSAKTIPQGLS